MSERKPKILYLVTEDWYFCSHRLPLACAAREKGFDVVVATHLQKCGSRIADKGIKAIPIRLRRKGKNPFKELLAISEIVRIYRQERPSIVHHVALKPVIYGSIAAIIARVPSIVNALAGMGYVFIADNWKIKLFQRFLKYAFRILLNRKNSVLVLQNPDDIKTLVDAKVIKKERTALIRGSGVDTNIFYPASEPDGVPKVTLASRMLWDKGVGEFVAAAQILKSQGVRADFMLAGDTDPDNPAAIPAEQLKRWHKEGHVQWIGHTEDIPKLFSKAHIVCLPSYREGLPKVLIEAAACGLPIVTTDVPGCREIVKDGVNGFLVPARDSVKLAEALLRLIENPALRREFGTKGRESAEVEFSQEKVIAETLAVYQELLSQ